jgi:hypothetical protein
MRVSLRRIGPPTLSIQQFAPRASSQPATGEPGPQQPGDHGWAASHDVPDQVGAEDHQHDRHLVYPEVVGFTHQPVAFCSTAKVSLNEGLNP